MAETKIIMQLHECDKLGNNVVSLNLENKGREVLQYSALMTYRHVTADYLVNHFAAFDAQTTTMGFIGDYREFLGKQINADEQKFLERYVVDDARKLVEKLRSMVEHPQEYLKELLFYRDLKRYELFSCLPISDAEVEEYNKNPQAMAVAILGEKVIEALEFTTNMFTWGTEFPQMRNYAVEIFVLAKQVSEMLATELSSLPLDACEENHRQFFCWWYLDNAFGVLKESIAGFDD